MMDTFSGKLESWIVVLLVTGFLYIEFIMCLLTFAQYGGCMRVSASYLLKRIV